MVSASVMLFLLKSRPDDHRQATRRSSKPVRLRSITREVMAGARPSAYLPRMLTTLTFGDLLRDWRLKRRMSQLDLALEAETSTRHLSFLETGRAAPSRDMAL